jgi:hypothetical protein
MSPLALASLLYSTSISSSAMILFARDDHLASSTRIVGDVRVTSGGGGGGWEWHLSVFGSADGMSGEDGCDICILTGPANHHTRPSCLIKT